MEQTNIAIILGLLGPGTAAVFKGFTTWMQYLAQKHQLALAREEQAHKITFDYLDRAMNPETPIARRQQLLRFLKSAGKTHNERLRNWATEELKGVDAIVAPLQKEVDAAIKELEKAKDEKALKKAEAVLALAKDKQASVLGRAAPPPITVAAIRAGAFASHLGKRLVGLEMPNEDLHGVHLTFTKMMNANMSGADLHDAWFNSTDLRGADFSEANLQRADFESADLRGANLKGANLEAADLTQAHLEAADLTGANLKDADVAAYYDDTTVWPEGFDVKASAAIHIDAQYEIRKAGEKPKD